MVLTNDILTCHGIKVGSINDDCILPKGGAFTDSLSQEPPGWC